MYRLGIIEESADDREILCVLNSLVHIRVYN